MNILTFFNKSVVDLDKSLIMIVYIRKSHDFYELLPGKEVVDNRKRYKRLNCFFFFFSCYGGIGQKFLFFTFFFPAQKRLITQNGHVVAANARSGG